MNQRILYVILLTFVLSCANQEKKQVAASTDKILIYPSYMRLKLSEELLGHAINKQDLARKEKNKSKRDILLEEFSQKYQQFEQISKAKILEYETDGNSYLLCKNERTCSVHHFALGLVCFKGDIRSAMGLLKKHFTNFSEEHTLNNIFIDKGRIHFTLEDKANGTKEENFFLECL
jgi:hypothetical protein